MYEQRHFTRAVHLLLAMGFISFAIAAESPGAMILGVGLTLLHAWLMRDHGTWHPPRAVGTAASLAAIGLVGIGLARGQFTPVLGFSYLLMTLILVKLYDWGSNRDIGQALVMSLLMMAAAAINSASLIFGLLFVAYLLLGLYVSLLLHLKSESDHAVASFAIPGDRLPLAQGKVQRSLRRSLRQVTTVMACVAVIAAVVVFLFFPRSGSPPVGGGSFGLTKPSPMTGFSERVSFDQVARITQNTDMVARLRLTKHGQTFDPGLLYLRGTTLGAYSGAATDETGPWEWFHLRTDEAPTVATATASAETPLISPDDSPLPADIQQDVILEPTGSSILFSLAGPSSIVCEQPMRLLYDRGDQSIRRVRPGSTAVRYRLSCTGELGQPAAPPPPPPPPTTSPYPGYQSYPRPWWPGGRGGRGFGGGYGDPGNMFRRTPRNSLIDPKIAAYARRPEVSGQTSSGKPLAEQREMRPSPDRLDETIARNIETHLQSTFSYTLDLTDTRRPADEDPIVGFLYDTKRGHCEYFAGAMTLMCQSLGMKARMVIGFRLGREDLNSMGDYYVVRQSHAHAWVEVLTSRGWMTFDPTAWRTAPHNTGVLARAGNFWDYLQYTWANSIITYSDEDRRNVVEDVSTGLQTSSDWTGEAWAWLRGLLKPNYVLSSRILSGTITLAILVAVGAVGAFVNEKYRMRRRAQRIGLDALPESDKLRMARQLAFYDQLLQLLARHKITRQRSLTPREFAQSLTFLPGRAYEHACQLTDVFYQVRFGQRDLSPARQRRLTNVIQEMARLLAGPSPY